MAKKIGPFASKAALERQWATIRDRGYLVPLERDAFQECMKSHPDSEFHKGQVCLHLRGVGRFKSTPSLCIEYRGKHYSVSYAQLGMEPDKYATNRTKRAFHMEIRAQIEHEKQLHARLHNIDPSTLDVHHADPSFESLMSEFLLQWGEPVTFIEGRYDNDSPRLSGLIKNEWIKYHAEHMNLEVIPREQHRKISGNALRKRKD